MNTLDPTSGQKVDTNWKISGPPSSEEVAKAIRDLKTNKASGSDSLAAECFKAGGDLLASRLVDDFRLVWPSEETWRLDPEVEESQNVPLTERVSPATEEEFASCQTQVWQSWQDAVMVTLFKNKGSPLDPGNYRGIFLLEVAGKILASVINSRIQRLSEKWMSDLQCGFRQRRGTLQQILAIRRAQQALRESDKDACILFIDFAKAFDSPPRQAIWNCLKHIGCPPDLLAVIEAIHDRPTATVRDSEVSFEMMRGIRQGCILGPSLFIILLDVLLEMSGCRDVLGVEFVGRSRGPIVCPSDILDVEFSVTDGEYADDCWFIAETPQALTEALHRLQAITGPLGLDISVAKTEWLWLARSTASIAMAEAICPDGVKPPETTDGICEEDLRRLVHLNGKICKKVREFNYLGSIISEDVGVGREIEVRCAKAMKALNARNSIWENPCISLRSKKRRLMSDIVPILMYACETWNTVDKDMHTLEVFLNKCRMRVLGESRLRPDGTVLSNASLHERVSLPAAHMMIARRRLSFTSRLVGEGECELARRMVFAECPRSRRIPARMMADYRKRLVVDSLNILAQPSVSPSVKDLFSQLVNIQAMRLITGDRSQVPRLLAIALQPRETLGVLPLSRALLLSVRERTLTCKKEGCLFRTAEAKELLRHARRDHKENVDPPGSPPIARESAASPAAGAPGTYLYKGEGPPYLCGYGSCVRQFKYRGGHLKNHIKNIHGVEVDFGLAPDRSQSQPGTKGVENGTETFLATGSGDGGTQSGVHRP